MSQQPEIRDRIIEHWRRFGISLEAQTKAMNASTEAIKQLIEQLPIRDNHEEAS